ncbi:uncharacterized protein [Pyrus communis]|uniref:uncharacterized protein n=1 Tax=Pyrus communis TaxID=23211 RepID=UPI0035C1B87D
MEENKTRKRMSFAPLGGYLDSPFPPPEAPQLHQQPRLGNDPDIYSHEILDPGTGGCIAYNTDNQAAAMNHMIPVTEEILAHKQLDSSVLGSGDHDDGEPGSGISSDFNDPAVDDMILEELLLQATGDSTDIFTDTNVIETLSSILDGEKEEGWESTTTRTTTAQSAPDMMAAIRFHPTDKEMADFLGKKMRSHKSQACHFLPVIDVYKSEPRALPELMFADSAFQAKAWYSFSLCDYKYTNSLRCNRATKHGFWKITGKPQDISSKYFTCKKRTLTFQTKTFEEGGASKSVRTGWIIHEYYCSKPKQGSSPCQERDVKRDYALCFLKYKPVYSKSDKKKPEGTSVCDDLADLGNCGYIASSPGDDHAASAAAMIHMTPDTEVLTYKELEDDLLGNENHDHGEPGGGVSSDSIDQALRDMIHEVWFYVPVCIYLDCFFVLINRELEGGGYLDSPFPPPETPQLHQPSHLGNAPDICSHELLDPGTGGCITYNTNNQAAAMNHMIPVTEEILAHKQLDSCVFGSGDHDVGELGGSISSDFNDPAVDDMILDLGKELDSPLSSPEPPQPHQPHRPHQLGNVLDIHSSKFSHWTSPIGDNDSYVTNTNNIATNYDNEPVMNIAYNSKNHATNEWISEVYSQAEENWGSTFQPFDQLQNYRLQSPILFSKPGELLHANNYIGCIELQSLAMEIATLSPQSS